MAGKDGPGSPDEGLGNSLAESETRATPASGPASPGTSSTVARGRESSGAAVDNARLTADETAPRKTERERSRRPRSGPGAAPPEPHQMLDLGDLPETYGKDEVGILTKDPFWYFVYWEVTEPGEVAAREQLGLSGESARLVLRLFITVASGAPAAGGHGHADGREVRELRDVALPQRHGRKYMEAPRPGALIRAAVGLLSSEGYFAPIAHSALVRMPPQQPATQASIEWLHVLPVRSEGHKRERIIAAPPSAPHQEPTLPLSVVAAAQSQPMPGQPVASAEEAELFPAGPLADAGSSPGQGFRPRSDKPQGPGPGLANGSGRHS